MRRHRRGLCLAILTAALAGCDSAAPYRSIVRDQAAAWDEVAEILSKVTDQDSMKTAGKELAKCRARSDAIQERRQDLPDPSFEIKQRLGEEAERLRQAVERAGAQIRRVNKLPGGEDFLKQLPGGSSLLQQLPNQ